MHVLGNVECEKAKNVLKTKIRPVCVLSEYDGWENSRVILTVGPLWAFCEREKEGLKRIYIFFNNYIFLTTTNKPTTAENTSTPHSYENQRLQRQFDGLLMVGIVMPETCWAVSVRQSNKIYDWLLHLVGCFYLSDLRNLHITCLHELKELNITCCWLSAYIYKVTKITE